MRNFTTVEQFLKPVCAKRPWGLERLLRKHQGETGVIIHGWFPRLSIHGPPEWMHVPVHVDGSEPEVVSQVGHRVRWLPARPGRVRIHVGAAWDGEALSPEMHTCTVDLRPGEVALFVFSTPRWSLFGRFRTPVWCEPVLVRRLGHT